MISKLFSYLAVLIFATAQAMELDLELFDKVQIEEYSKLSLEEKKSLNPANYTADIQRGRNVLRALADAIIARMQEMGSFEDETNLNQLKIKAAQLLIERREKVLSDTPIEVTDKRSAQARAAQRLNNEQKAALQFEGFKTEREQAIVVIHILATYTFEELINHELIEESTNKEEFLDQFCELKIKQLEKAYTGC